MMNFLRHADFIELSRYADDELDPQARTRVEAHLHACGRCRTELAFIRQLGDAARELPAPGPSENALERVLARRAAGERVIVPLEGPIGLKKGSPRGFLGLAAAMGGALLAALAAVVMLAPRAEADRGTLEFSTDRPRAGQEVEVDYSAGRLFEGETRLLLRARYRYEGGTTQQLVAAELPRSDDDVYSGRIVLPDSVAYAVFAVEDPSASRVDSNGRRLWELVVHGEDGRPTFAALRERVADLRGRNWQVAYQTSKRMTELYPEEPESWVARLQYERGLFEGAELEKLLAQHRREYRRLSASVVGANAENLAWLWNYAALLLDSGEAERLGEVLVGSFPGHPLSLQIRARQAREDCGADADCWLAQLEELWQEGGAEARLIVSTGFNTARDAGDRKAFLRWADRTARVYPQNALAAGEQLVQDPATREAGIQRLRAALAHFEAGELSERGIEESGSAFRFRRDADLQRALAALGEALVRAGHTRAGLDTLRLAAEKGWNPGVFRSAATALLSLGEPAAALDFLARVATDPATPLPDRDSIAALALSRVSPNEWTALLSRSERTMRDMLLNGAVRRHVEDGLPLKAMDGQGASFDELRSGGVAFVAFWSRLGPRTHDQDLQRLEHISRDLASRGVRVITVTSEPPSPELRRFAAERGLTFPVYSDVSGDVARAFGQWGTPEYFLVDTDGVIRFEYTTLDAALRQAAVLLPSATRPTVADQ